MHCRITCKHEHVRHDAPRRIGRVERCIGRLPRGLIGRHVRWHGEGNSHDDHGSKDQCEQGSCTQDRSHLAPSFCGQRRGQQRGYSSACLGGTGRRCSPRTLEAPLANLLYMTRGQLRRAPGHDLQQARPPGREWTCCRAGEPRLSPHREQIRPGAAETPRGPEHVARGLAVLAMALPSPIDRLQPAPAPLPNRRRGLPAIFDLEDQIDIPLWTSSSGQIAPVPTAGSISGPEPSIRIGVVVVGNKTALRIITVIPLEEESVVPGPGKRERGIEYEVHASQVNPIARDSDAGPIAQDVPRVGPEG